jgi:hypothetical protein
LDEAAAFIDSPEFDGGIAKLLGYPGYFLARAAGGRDLGGQFWK